MRRVTNESVLNWLSRHETQTALSTVALAEIAFGIFSLRQAERSPRFLDQLLDIRERYADRLHAFDERAAIMYGQVMGQRNLAGRPMSSLDGMIAAIALRHNASLATRNVSHFEGTGLKLVNPWD